MKKTLVLILLCLSFAVAEENLIGKGMTPEATKAVQNGLAYLARTQRPSGAWHGDAGYKLNNSYRVTKEKIPHVGGTSLACLAFMASGNLPNRGRYGRNVRKGLEFILDSVHPATGYVTKHGTRMYSHAFATLFLAEIYGMNGGIKVRKKLQQAVKLIIECQNAQGGWRYEPIAMDADLSISVCQVQALRAARNVGIRVSKKHIERAIDYIKRSSHYGGGFKYQDLPMSQTRITYAITAAGVTALHGAGVYDGPIVERGLKFLANPPARESRYSFSPKHYFYYYGHYYAAQAMYTAGNPYWGRWYPRVRNQLIDAQNADGSWRDNVGRICSTSMAIIILQTPLKYLPIFQR